jgi:dTDP-4-dehydrorhamnose 3,5-epimerase
VLRGAVFDVAVDIRRASPTFGRHVATRLTAEGGEQLFVPAGFAHGFCALEPDTELAYKVSDFYAREQDAGILWNDPALGIDWPLGGRAPVLSERDLKHPLLADAASGF